MTKRPAPWLAASALTLVALLEMAAQRWRLARVMVAQDYAELRQPVAAVRAPHEAIEVSPAWATPYLRQALGDGLLPLPLLARPDDASQASILTITLPPQQLRPRRGWSVEVLSAVGPFRLYRQHNLAFRPPVTDFVAAFRHDNVTVNSGPRGCPFIRNGRRWSGGLAGPPTFPRQRFQCPGGSFFFVGKTVIADQHFRPRQCLWAHPPSAGVLSIRFDGVPLGKQLVGHSGMYWITERAGQGAPVRLRVLVDGVHLATIIHHDGDGWARFEAPLGPHAGKAQATVEWQISTSNNRHRHFCFEARSW